MKQHTSWLACDKTYYGIETHGVEKQYNHETHAVKLSSNKYVDYTYTPNAKGVVGYSVDRLKCSVSCSVERVFTHGVHEEIEKLHQYTIYLFFFYSIL